MRALRWLMGFFFIVLPMGFIALGAGMAWRQHAKLKGWHPVPATVLSTNIESHRGSKGGTTYSPVVEYRYEVAGASYVSKKALPLSESSGHSWAAGIVHRYPPNSKTTAYYNPADPSEAYLVHQYSFFPYLFVLFPMIHLSVGIGLVFMSGWMGTPQRPPPPSPEPGAWFSLVPRTSLYQKLRGWLVMMMLWFGVGALAAGHYFMNASTYEGLAIGASIAYFALGLIPLSGWIYYLLLMRRTSDPVVMTDCNSFRNGQSFQVRVMQPIYRDTIIQQAKVGLVCAAQTKTKQAGKTSYDIITEFETWNTVLENQQIRGGETLEKTAALTIPADRSCSTFDGYPRYMWKVEVRAALKDSPDYRAEFPILVDRPRGDSTSA